MLRGEGSGLLTRMATESVSSCTQTRYLRRFVELERADTQVRGGFDRLNIAVSDHVAAEFG